MLPGRMVRRTAAALSVAAAIGLCAALASGGAAPVRADENEQDVEQATQASVSIIDFGFMPASVTVAVGGRVTWTNTGNAPHTSTSQAGGWDSGRLTNGQTFSFTFPRAGSFAYICTIHPNMMGTVVVQAAAGAAPPAAAPPAAAPPAAQPPRPVATPPAQRPAAPAAQRPAAAPARPAAAAPVVRPAAQPASAARVAPRTGTGITADNTATLPALVLGGVLVLGVTGLMLRKRKA